MNTPEIRVIVHYDEPTFWADSPEVDGWTAAANSMPELHQLIVEGVPFALDVPPEKVDLRLEWDDGRRVVVYGQPQGPPQLQLVVSNPGNFALEVARSADILADYTAATG